jgi:hypothetical protein
LLLEACAGGCISVMEGEKHGIDGVGGLGIILGLSQVGYG